MAYSEHLAGRIRDLIDQEPTLAAGMAEKKMFGGIAFMLDGHMTVGVKDDALMVRVGKPHTAAALQEPHARAMDITGKPLGGFVFVDAEGISEDPSLLAWLMRAVAFVSTLPPKPPKAPKKAKATKRPKGKS